MSYLSTGQYEQDLGLDIGLDGWLSDTWGTIKGGVKTAASWGVSQFKEGAAAKQTLAQQQMMAQMQAQQQQAQAQQMQAQANIAAARAAAQSAAIAPPSGMPKWLLPVGIGGAALVLVLMMKKK